MNIVDLSNLETREARERYMQEAFSTLFTAFPLSIIAGGFVRDVLFGITPKDVDVWYPLWNNNVTADGCQPIAEAIMALLGTSLDLGRLPTGNTYENTVFIFRSVVEDGKYPVEIMFHQRGVTVDDVFADFDIPLCEAAINRSGVITSRAFDKCVADNFSFEISYHHFVKSPDLAIDHIRRVKAKFKNLKPLVDLTKLAGEMAYRGLVNGGVINLPRTVRDIAAWPEAPVPVWRDEWAVPFEHLAQPQPNTGEQANG